MSKAIGEQTKASIHYHTGNFTKGQNCLLGLSTLVGITALAIGILGMLHGMHILNTGTAIDQLSKVGSYALIGSGGGILTLCLVSIAIMGIRHYLRRKSMEQELDKLNIQEHNEFPALEQQVNKSGKKISNVQLVETLYAPRIKMLKENGESLKTEGSNKQVRAEDLQKQIDEMEIEAKRLQENNGVDSEVKRLEWLANDAFLKAQSLREKAQQICECKDCLSKLKPGETIEQVRENAEKGASKWTAIGEETKTEAEKLKKAKLKANPEKVRALQKEAQKLKTVNGQQIERDLAEAKTLKEQGERLIKESEELSNEAKQLEQAIKRYEQVVRKPFFGEKPSRELHLYYP